MGKKLTFLFILFYSFVVNSQTAEKLFLNSGAKSFIKIEENAFLNTTESIFGGNAFIVLHYKQVPSESQILLFKQNGLLIGDYLADHSYQCMLTPGFIAAADFYAHFDGYYVMKASDKYAAEVFTTSRKFNVVVFEEFEAEALKFLRTIVKDGTEKLATQGYIQVQATFAEIAKIATLPFVLSVDKVIEDYVPTDLRGNSMHRDNAISNPLGRNLKGEGVVIAVADGGYTEHIDYQNRVFNQNTGVLGGFGTHGDHVTGIVTGGFRINPNVLGMAPKASVYTNQAGAFLLAMATNYSTLGMVLTNNSWGVAGACASFGAYNSTSRALDIEMRNVNNVLHVFAAGNSGGTSCAPAPAGFKTILPYYQTAKNLLTVGNMAYTETISASSSKGPTKDGRIKPEICGVGENVNSTQPTNGYGLMTGTSMASPGVMGSLALLYQRYRQLNSGADPDAALIKALVMNTAEDIGNKGPDFRYGFGRLNALKASVAMENGYYSTSNISHGDSATISINVPSGTTTLKILLHWKDVEGSGVSYYSLVNNLDLEVRNPSSTLFRPWVLDTSSGGITSLATRGIDNLNNTEQVTIHNPTSGSYSIKVKGKNVPSGPQKYWLTYDFGKQNVGLTYPFAQEKMAVGSIQTIRWDTSGITSGTFKLEYSADSGSSWNNINASVAYNTIYYNWTVPNQITNKAMVRLVHNTLTGVGDTSLAFTIMPVSNLVSANSCSNQAKMTWRKVNTATSYNLYQLVDHDWILLANTSDSFRTVPNLQNGQQYWFTVEAVKNDIVSQKDTGISVTISNTNCAMSPDAGIASIVSPLYGRKFTSMELSSSQAITVSIINFGNASLTNFPVKYRINGGGISSETYSTTLASLASGNYTFSATSNLSSTGNYLIEVWTDFAGDLNRQNDTLKYVIKHLNNNALSLPYFEGFENVPDTTSNVDIFGLNGADRYDYTANTTEGRFNTNLRNDLKGTGLRSISLDKRRHNATINKNTFTGTYNLGAYNSSSNLLLSFAFSQTGEDKNDGDSVWIRGHDTLPWVGIYDLYANRPAAGVWKTVSTINITNLLAVKGQAPCTGLQIRFGQEDNSYTRTLNDSDGLHFDNINIINSPNEVQLLSIVAPVSGCGMGTDSLKISVKNNGTTSVTNLPVAYQQVGNTIYKDTIASTITAGSTITYTIKTPFNFSTPGLYNMKAWVGLAVDSLKTNDTLIFNIRSVYKVSSFPFLEGFESNNGQFYVEGTNSSWEWGTPASNTNTKIAGNGTKVWATSLSGDYNDLEYSYLYSPCFDLTSFTSNPILSFNYLFKLESGFDYGWVEFSENGTNWFVLGTFGGGTNWYNVNPTGWTNIRDRWQVTSYTIPSSSMTNKSNVRFRWVMYADGGVTDDGIGLDDVHLFGGTTPINTVTTFTPLIKKVVSGTGWNHFDYNGRRVLSLFDDGKNLDTVTVGVKINTAAVRTYNSQKTLDRNWWVIPKNTVTGNYRVRLHFLQTELNSLDAVDDSVYSFKDLGVTKYDGTNVDSSFTNDDIDPSKYTFIPKASVLAMPYNDGMYLEFGVTSFSEFWINVGGTNRLTPLPVEWISFKANKLKNANGLYWSIIPDGVQTKYEIYRKSGKSGMYSSIGLIKPSNSPFSVNNFEYYDSLKEASGIYYYKIAAISESGNKIFSEERSVNYDNLISNPYPNPTKDKLFLNTTYNAFYGITISTATGKVVMKKSIKSSEGKLILDISTLLQGPYILSVETPTGVQQFFIVKE